MTSQTGQQKITIYVYIYVYIYIYIYMDIYIYILSNISKSNGHWKMKFGQLIEYNMTNIFPEN